MVHFSRFQASTSSNTAFKTITTGAATITQWLNRRPAAWPAIPITIRTGAVPTPNATIAIAPSPAEPPPLRLSARRKENRKAGSRAPRQAGTRQKKIHEGFARRIYR